MRPAVFILGTSHPLQCGAVECGVDRIALLEEKVRQALSEHGIRRIAEEMSEDALRDQLGEEAARGTVCQRIARDEGIGVDFVDLDERERDRLRVRDGQCLSNLMMVEGISGSALSWVVGSIVSAVRERVWVARVLSGDEWPVLFVCGANHADSVGDLFEGVEVQATIICRDFAPQPDP